MAKVETITTTRANIGIEILTANVNYEFSGVIISKILLLAYSSIVKMNIRVKF